MPMNARCAKTAKSTGIRREIEPGLETGEKQMVRKGRKLAKGSPARSA